jgi:hypothetical protein
MMTSGSLESEAKMRRQTGEQQIRDMVRGEEGSVTDQGGGGGDGVSSNIV